MKLKSLGSEDTSSEIICESFLVSDINSFDEVIVFLHEYENKYKEFSILLTLDDLNQAHYTSMHATMAHDLNETDGYDLSQLDPRAFEGGEHIGYLSTQSEFFIRKANFERKIESVSFIDACKRGLTISEEELTLLESIHRDPMTFIDSEIIVRLVPVESSFLAISAFPNGYFRCDLNPFENYAVAKKLHEKYGYKLFGIGASLLGFVRDDVLNEQSAVLLAADIALLYNTTESDPHINSLINLAKTHNYFFLKYIESLEE